MLCNEVRIRIRSWDRTIRIRKSWDRKTIGTDHRAAVSPRFAPQCSALPLANVSTRGACTGLHRQGSNSWSICALWCAPRHVFTCFLFMHVSFRRSELSVESRRAACFQVHPTQRSGRSTMHRLLCKVDVDETSTSRRWQWWRTEESEMAAQAAEARPSTVCAVCLQDIQDARLLPCLHSFCRACIDQQAVTATEREIRCSICRSSYAVLEGGAATLPKDSLRPSRPRSCTLCCDDGNRGTESDAQPSRVCTTCDSVLCDKHLVDHLGTPGSHSIGNLSDDTAAASGTGETSAPATCPIHGDPLKFFCRPCGVLVCGYCIAVGDHGGHKPICIAKDVSREKIEDALNRIQPLREALERTERSSVALNEASDHLPVAARGVREEICASATRAIHVVEACKAQLLQRVDDAVVEREKVLNLRSEELKSYQDSLRNAIMVGERLSRHTGNEAYLPLASALRSRADTLVRAESVTMVTRGSGNAGGQPFVFDVPADEVLPARAMALLGELRQMNMAKADRCVVSAGDGSSPATAVYAPLGKKCTLHVSMCDGYGQPREVGGDIISATWKAVPDTNKDVLPSPGLPPTITANGRQDATFDVSFSLQHDGQYTLQIEVNCQPVAAAIEVTCGAKKHALCFSRTEHHPCYVISDDGKKATATQEHFSSAVLGSMGFRHGKHVWRCMVGDPVNYHVVGVIWKPYDIGNLKWTKYMGWASDCKKYDTLNSGGAESPVNHWKGGDTLELRLDCDAHTLKITNQRSGLSDEVTGLPDQELFPAFYSFRAGNNFTLVDWWLHDYTDDFAGGRGGFYAARR